MADAINSVIESFISEAQELLRDLESSLLDLSTTPDPETIDATFRALHTIKGSAAMFGFEALAGFAHHFETAFDLVREGKLPADDALIALSLQARDHLSALLACERDAAAAEALAQSDAVKALTAQIEALIAGEPAAAADQPVDAPAEPRAEATAGPAGENRAERAGPIAEDRPIGPERLFAIDLRPEPDALLNGMRPDLLIEELAEMGEIAITLDAAAVPTLEALAPQTCLLGWRIHLRTTRRAEDVEGVFIFADDSEVNIQEVAGSPLEGANVPPHPAARREQPPRGPDSHAPPTAPARASAPPEPPDGAPPNSTNESPAPDRPPRLNAPPPTGAPPASAPPASAGSAQADQRAASAAPGQSRSGVSASSAHNASKGSLRIPAARLDELVDQLGELVIVQSRLEQIASQMGAPALEAVVEEVDRLISSLRDSTLSIRMLPIETVFDRFRRVAHDLARDLGKPLSLRTEGGATEVDKNVLDRLTDPLVHMIRNAADHGIEAPETRAALGKPEIGEILLCAHQEGGEVVIRIQDDGAGLNPERIRDRAVERGLIDADAELAEADLYALIFQPGFSTADAVSNVSGRGVGMDAVRVAIDQLGGQLRVESERGRGAQVTLRLPLSLAIIDGMLVRLGDAVFVIPLAAVEECVEFEAEAERRAARSSGRTTLSIRDELVPYVELEEALDLPASDAARRRVVIVSAEGRRLGIVIDDILGQNQTVIKKLSPYHRDVEGFAGATILGDGSVALILDVASLTRRSARLRQERGAAPPAAPTMGGAPS